MSRSRPFKDGSENPTDKVANVEDQEASNGNEVDVAPAVSLKND